MEDLYIAATGGSRKSLASPRPDTKTVLRYVSGRALLLVTHRGCINTRPITEVVRAYRSSQTTSRSGRASAGYMTLQMLTALFAISF